MPKKTKRQVRRVVTPETNGPAAAFTSSRALDRDFNPDYSVIIRDLRRIGILAGSFFLILIALSFILPLIIP